MPEHHSKRSLGQFEGGSGANIAYQQYAPKTNNQSKTQQSTDIWHFSSSLHDLNRASASQLSAAVF
jgi:hypothetical protein